MCNNAHSCCLQSVCDARHYRIRCGKTKCVWMSTYHTRFVMCLENSHAWNLPRPGICLGLGKNHKTPTVMAMPAQTSSKDESFRICETSETVLKGQLYASRFPIPDGFWVVWEGPPLSPTLTWWRFQMSSRKGVKNRLFRTDAQQCLTIKLSKSSKHWLTDLL